MGMEAYASSNRFFCVDVLCKQTTLETAVCVGGGGGGLGLLHGRSDQTIRYSSLRAA